jgi:L-cysteine S-thiosulfotransferase
MNMKNTQRTPIASALAAVALAAVSVAVLSACANTSEAPAPKEPTQAEIAALLKASFADRGVAKLDRLDQTDIQRECSEANAAAKEVAADKRAKLEKAAMAAIPKPADGNYLGDWKEGERIAQNGRGLQFSDAAGTPNGANCYACHQIGPSEISYGNQGPSLYNYGKLRGVTDPKAESSKAMLEYTWGRIWNTHAYNACSNMPRFGDAGILTQEQIKHVMALLLDPASPVNK